MMAIMLSMDWWLCTRMCFPLAAAAFLMLTISITNFFSPFFSSSYFYSNTTPDSRSTITTFVHPFDTSKNSSNFKSVRCVLVTFLQYAKPTSS